MELPRVKPIEPPGEPSPVHSNWYLVNVRHKKRDLFLRCLNVVIKQNQLDDLILAVETPDDSVYQDIVLLNLASFKAVQPHIQTIESCQRIEPKPLPQAQVSLMLAASR